MVTVQDGIDDLWNCQGVKEVYDRLKSLHQVLLTDRVGFDPSEAFLAIQGASLRFLPSLKNQQRQWQEEFKKEQAITQQTADNQKANDGVKGDESKIDAEREEKEKIERLHWSVTEESLWAAAALACVCVGPAWRAQTQKRKQSLAQKRGEDENSVKSSASFYPPDELQLGNTRSFSPGFTAVSALSTGQTITRSKNIKYPSIPEVLPAAMLRFAASVLTLIPDRDVFSSMKEKERDLWKERKKKIAIGQRYLVLALCCESPIINSNTAQEEEQSQHLGPKSTEWTIPGANELVGDMLYFWLKVACPLDDGHRRPMKKTVDDIKVDQEESEKEYIEDWWYTLGVTRATTDLVSTGWRPLSRSNLGFIMVKHLLEIAETGISLLDTHSCLRDQKSTSETKPKEERLAASSSAAEAISALASLGSRGLIPAESQRITTRKICRLHVISGLIKASIAGVFPLGSRQNEKQRVSESERKIFLTQIESCFADTTDFLWILFSTQTSSANAIRALLDTVNAADPSSPVCLLFSNNGWDSDKKLICMEAGTAVRMVSAAIWGRPPGAMNTAHLRAYMDDILNTIRGISFSLHSHVHGRLDTGDFIVPSTCDFLSLLLDSVVALGSFADRQLVGGADLVSSVEWDVFLHALEEAFVPWLDYSNFNSTMDATSNGNEVAKVLPSILERAHLELQSLLLRVGAFLDKYVRIEGSPFHSIVSYSSQRKLYLFILNTAIPHMDPTDAELLGLSVARAWAKFGLYPFRVDDLAQTTSEILSQTFSIYENGRYVHSPNVRLRALRALTASESETSMQSDNMDESCGPSDGSARSRISQFSVLAIARDMTELLTKINKSLIPILESVLSKTHRNPPGQCIIPLPSDNYGKLGHEHGYKNSGVILTLSADNSFPLESYAIRLVGKLIRTISSERKTRSLLINLLGSVALDSRWKMDSFGKSDVEHGNLHERRLQGSVRLVAVRELEKCLAAPFGDLLQVHEIVPVVIELLCFILISCTAPIDDVNVEFSTEWHYERTVVAFAALVPLCRLRICPDGSKLALLSNSQIAKYIPVFLLSILGRHGSSGDYGHISQLSPFIIVNGTGSASGQNAGSKMTVLSFEPIVSSITTALGSARRARDQVKVEICTLLQILSSLCFHALTSYLYSGFQLDDIELFEDFIFSSGIEASSESAQELLGRSKTLAALTESTIARYSNQKAVPGVKEGDKAAHSSRVGSLFNLLLYACDSTRHAESIAASRAVIATLPSLICIGAVKVSGKDPITTTFARIASRLQREVVALERIRSAEHASLVIQETASLLAILHDTVNDVKNLVPTDDVLFCFDLCKSIVRGMLHQPPSYCLHLAIRCMVASIDRMPSETAKSLLSDETRWAFELEDDKTVASTPSDCFDLTADFIGRLVSELLVQRMRTHSGAEESSTTFKIRNHEEMALEVDSMERFEIEESQGASQPSKSVWLCGESLLVSFRIGSSTSRYRGWVEIVIRCPTFRKRELVRLLSKFSVGNPDPSTLWTLNLPSSIKDEKIPLLVRPVHYDTEQVLERYKSLCSRFDLLLPPTSQDDQISAEQTSPVSIAEGSSSPQAKQTHQTGGLIASTANLNVNSPGFSASENVTNRGDQFIGETMYEWLKNALENDDNVKDVLVALHKLNLPDELIHQGTSNDPKALDVDVKTLFPARRLKTGPKLDRAIAVLDRTTPSNTHKVALLYASPFNIDSSEANLESESLLLSMKHCSPAFIRFADGLGNLVATKHLRYFSAGLDVSHYESDGLFTRVWVGNEGSSLPATKSIVVYHAVYLMPEGINNRKRHVGNDNVLILFVEKDSPVAVDVDLSEEESDESVVSGHFGFVTIYVSMLPQPDLARVTVRIRRGLPDALRMELLNFAGNDIIAMHDAPAYVRGLAIRADLACRSVLDNLAPASNCYERYRMLWEMNRYVVK